MDLMCPSMFVCLTAVQSLKQLLVTTWCDCSVIDFTIGLCQMCSATLTYRKMESHDRSFARMPLDSYEILYRLPFYTGLTFYTPNAPMAIHVNPP